MMLLWDGKGLVDGSRGYPRLGTVESINSPRGTLGWWKGRLSATLLTPLATEMRRRILLSEKLHTDDAPVPARNGSIKGGKTPHLRAS
jgi:hypothetical protein